MWLLRPDAHTPIEFIFSSSSALHRRIAESGLTHAYVPPWFATNAHVQLLMFCFLPQATEHAYDRELVRMDDGGQVALDWIPSTLPSSAPIVLVLHTLAGCSQDMREFCRAATASGYRAVVFNKRGHGNTKLTTPKLQAFGCTQDMHTVIAHIQTTFPGVVIVGVGYSAGAGLLSSYLGETGASSKLAAGVLVSPGYNHYTVHASSTSPRDFHNRGGLHPIYNYMMAKSLQRLLAPHHEILAEHIDLSAATSATCMADFDRAVYIKLHQFDSLAKYWEKSDPMRDVAKIAVPTLFLSAKDDPVCPTRLIDVTIVDRNPHLMLAFTSHGSHCGFFEHKNGRLQSWAPAAALAYIDNVVGRVE
ncbi:hypothetical protein, variant 1 [Aphanomyces invadans]|uniref:Serine aminopeptidase S33 domain-containing protein n=1 Tax=Aphanomyces invadans TaxID=157072 RepID=A0A024UK11_9STRA|nr:hypothetical protein, variant 1 [Aphanomyces invadans]ETW06207.1 hypothetical protein, variant 1 [Aphanomyces invadans]|eukprot:XP_008864282.1 hypothetical protein, variant 1 [Aphanomyces invadans]